MALWHSPSSLLKVMHSFLPRDVLNEMKFKENGQVHFSTSRFTYFGTTDQFIELLKLFRYFTGSSNFFHMEIAEPYCTLPSLYSNAEQKQFMYKKDQFVFLQSYMDWKPLDEGTNKLIVSLMGYVLKTWERRLDGTLEMVSIDMKAVDRFSEATLAKVKAILSLRSTTPKSIELTYEEFFKQLTLVLPPNEKDPGYLSVRNRVNEYAKYNLFKRYRGLARCLVAVVIVMVEELGRFIDSRPGWFRPHPPNYVPKKEFVRVFLNCERKCSMAYELMPFLTEASANFVKKQADSGLFVAIWDHHIEQEFKDAKDYIEFVEFEVMKALNRAVYIPSVADKYCIFASDLLFELLTEMISFKGIFQNLDKYNVKVVQEFFKMIDPIFSSTLPGPFFVSTGAAKGVRQKMNEHFDEHKEHFEKMKKPRKVGPNGFTLNDLMAEVRHLGLKDGVFGNQIDQFTEFYYACMLNRSNPENKTDADMHRALEDIQVICIFRSFPKLHQFAHLHGVCNSTPFACTYCSGTPIHLSIKKSEQIVFKSSEQILEDKIRRGMEMSMENLNTS